MLGKIFGDTTLGLSWHNTFAKSQSGEAAAAEVMKCFSWDWEYKCAQEMITFEHSGKW